MTTDSRGAEAGALLVAARRAGRAAAVPDWAPATVAEAWAAQDAVAEAFGPVGGWKVGPGEPRALAPILAETILPDGAEAQIGNPEGLAAEVEIGFRLARALPAGAAPDDAAALEMIGSAHVCGEICAVRLLRGHEAPPLWKLADAQTGAGAVIGPEIGGWRDLDWTALTARLRVDEVLRVERRGGHPTGDPVALFADALRLIARRGGAPAGALVITGSWTGMTPVTAPARIEAEFEGLGAVRFTLT